MAMSKNRTWQDKLPKNSGAIGSAKTVCGSNCSRTMSNLRSQPDQTKQCYQRVRAKSEPRTIHQALVSFDLYLYSR